MHKGTSNALQSRAVRNVIHSTNNSGGVDESAFGGDDEIERKSLVREKTEIAYELSKIKGEWHLATLSKDRRRLDHLHLSRQALVKKNIDIELRLTELRRAKKDRQGDPSTFERTFMYMAKEMLAGPVYDRVLIATIHRCGETQEGHENDK